MTDNLWREAVERMASAQYDIVRMDNDDAIQWELLRKDNYEAVRLRHNAMACISALLEIMAERGLELKPLVATDGMAVAVRHLDFTSPTDIDWSEGYATMCAAFPRPLKPPTPEAT